MKSLQWIRFLGLALAVFAAPMAAAASGDESTSFEYVEFPAVPVLPQATGEFIKTLQTGCEEVAKLPEPIEVKSVAQTSLEEKVRAFNAAVEGYTDAKKKLEAAKQQREADASSGKEVEETAKKVEETAKKKVEETVEPLVGEVADLQQVCAKLKNPDAWAEKAERGEKLTKADLETLRKYRDSKYFPALVTLVQRYVESQVSDAPVEALTDKGQLRAKVSAASIVGGDAIVDKALNGLADFMVKRAKEEAIVAIQEQIKKRICSDGEAKIATREFLRDTCTVLMTLDASLSLRAMGTQMHAAAVADLRRLPDVSLAYSSFLQTSDAKRVPFELGRLGYAMGREVADGRSAVDVFAAVHAMSKLPCERDESCAAAMKSVRKLSAIVHVLWIEEFSTTIAQVDASKAGVTLVAALLTFEDYYEPQPEYQEKQVRAALRKTASIWPAVRQFEAVLSNLQELDGLSSAPEERAQKLELIARIVSQTAAAVRDLDKALTSSKLLERDTSRTEGLEHFVSAANVVAKLISEDWGGAAIASIQHLDKALTDYVKGASGDEKKLRQKRKDQIDRMLRVVPLLVEIANADSSKEVALAIEAAAAPSGSYRAKYQHWTLSLNGFVGVAGGGEWLSSEGVRGTSGMVAGFAPIGVHVAAPFGGGGGKCKACRFHVGGAITVLDLGALTTYRLERELEEDSTEDAATAQQAPQIGLPQVFSPGAYLTFGLFRLPMVVGFGASMSPQLRRITDASQDTRDVTTLRVMGFVAVDVTLFQFR